MKGFIKLFLNNIIYLLKYPSLKKAYTSQILGKVILGKGVLLQKKSFVFNSEINNNSGIGEYTEVSGSKVGEFITIAKNSIVINSSFEEKLVIYENCKIYNSKVGRHSYISEGGRLFNTSIGRYCSIGPNVIFGHGKHPIEFISTSPIFYSPIKQTGSSFIEKGSFQEFPEIIVGNDIWVGANCYIKYGIKIGDGAVVGAGSVVTKDVPPYAIVGGVPAKIIKYRFPEEVVSKLKIINWWDWSDTELKERLDLFQKEIHNINDLGKMLKKKNMID